MAANDPNHRAGRGALDRLLLAGRRGDPVPMRGNQLPGLDRGPGGAAPAAGGWRAPALALASPGPSRAGSALTRGPTRAAECEWHAHQYGAVPHRDGVHAERGEPALHRAAEPAGVGAAVGRRTTALADVAAFVKTIPGGPPKFLVAKPGLDGHSNGAEQIAVAARDSGMEVVYSGIRLTPEQIVASARDEDPDVIGLSILSGSHMQLVPDVVKRLRAEGVDAPVIVGGIIPEEDRDWLLSHDVAAVYTPKDFDIARIMREVAELAAAHRNN